MLISYICSSLCLIISISFCCLCFYSSWLMIWFITHIGKLLLYLNIYFKWLIFMWCNRMTKGLSASVFNSPYFNVSRANESSLEEILCFFPTCKMMWQTSITSCCKELTGSLTKSSWLRSRVSYCLKYTNSIKLSEGIKINKKLQIMDVIQE